MGKIQDDNEKAFNNRFEVFKVLEKILIGSIFSVEMKQDEKIKSHSFLLWNDKVYSYRILDLRFDNGSGIYWKDSKSPATFEHLKVINPIFIVVLKSKGIIRSLATFDMDNHFMKESKYWVPGGTGNKNRLQNIKIPRTLHDQVGFEIEHERCPKLIEYFNSLFE